MEAKFEYTQNLKKIFDTRTEKLQSYYSREDITEARNEYIQAPADAKQFRWKDLERMCKARKIDQNQVIEDETLLEKIPTREEMKKELLQHYCTWLFDILFELEKELDISNYSTNDKRVFGFVSERLLDAWLITNNIAYEELDVVYMESQHWLRKWMACLNRKFFPHKEAHK